MSQAKGSRAGQERSTHLQSKGCEILAKPFDLNDLLALLRKVLGPPD